MLSMSAFIGLWLNPKQLNPTGKTLLISYNFANSLVFNYT